MISAVVWLPTYRQMLNGIDWPGDDIVLFSPIRFLGHMLPWTEALSQSPSFSVSSFVLLACLLSLVARGLTPRFRVRAAITLLLLFFSFLFPPTLFVWNAFDTPNGNPWRAAFVIAFMATIVASYSADQVKRISLKEVTIVGGVIAVLFVISTMEGANRQFLGTFAILSIILPTLALWG